MLNNTAGEAKNFRKMFEIIPPSVSALSKENQKNNLFLILVKEFSGGHRLVE
jgi:hypothetical protein